MCPELQPQLFPPNFPALIHLFLSQTSPFYHFFCVYSKRLFTLSFISSLDHPFTFFFSFVHFTFSPLDIRSSTTYSGTFCMTSSCMELPSILLRSKISSNFSSSSHCTSIKFSFLQSSCSCSSSFSICEQSQFCSTLCAAALCAVALASSCALACSLMPATTS